MFSDTEKEFYGLNS